MCSPVWWKLWDYQVRLTPRFAASLVLLLFWAKRHRFKSYKLQPLFSSSDFVFALVFIKSSIKLAYQLSKFTKEYYSLITAARIPYLEHHTPFSFTSIKGIHCYDITRFWIQGHRMENEMNVY